MSPDPHAASPAARQAGKIAKVVHALVGQVLADPGKTDSLKKVRRLMEEADGLGGTLPDPIPALGAPGSARFFGVLADFYLRHRRRDEGLEALGAAFAADPEDIVLRRRLFEALNSAGRLGEIGPVLKMPRNLAGGPDEAAALDLLRRAEKVLRLAGEEALSLDAAEQAAAFTPWDSALVRRLATRAEAIGDSARAKRLMEQLRRVWGKRLPARLADGLAALRESAAPLPAPDEALAWAWALADRQAWNKDDWRRALDLSGRSAKLLVQWWAIRRDRADEIADLVEAPDFSDLRAAQAQGRAQVMVGAHAGPLPAAIHLLEASGLPFRTLGGDGLDHLAGEGTLIPVASRSGASRELIKAIRRAAVLAVACDTPTGADRVELDFLGRRVAVKSLPARLAQRYGCDTWWYQPLWRGDRIIIELERLPDPKPDERPQAWAERWSRAYLKRLKRVMRGDPRNLNLSSGIWRFANSPASSTQSGIA